MPHAAYQQQSAHGLTAPCSQQVADNCLNADVMASTCAVPTLVCPMPLIMRRSCAREASAACAMSCSQRSSDVGAAQHQHPPQAAAQTISGSGSQQAVLLRSLSKVADNAPQCSPGLRGESSSTPGLQPGPVPVQCRPGAASVSYRGSPPSDSALGGRHLQQGGCVAPVLLSINICEQVNTARWGGCDTSACLAMATHPGRVRAE